MKTHTLLSICLIALFLTGCGGSNSTSSNTDDWEAVSQEGQQVANDQAAPPKAADKATSADEYSIKDGTGKILCRIQAGKVSTIFTNGRTLKGSYTKADKKKYRAGGSVFAEVKMKDYGFKVRQADGSLLWKVKVYEEELKIADNEEGLNAFKVKQSEAGKVKIKKGELELAKFEVDKEKGFFTLPNGQSYEITPMNKAIYYGVMGIEEIQAPYNYIILAELLSRP